MEFLSFVSMELDISDLYSSIFIFIFASNSVFDILKLVLVLLLVLMLSRWLS